MITAHTVAQIRAAEDAAFAVLGAPDDDGSSVLMQRAAAGLTSVLVEALGTCYGARILLIAGTGHNAGDGLYAAARLARRGVGVDVVRTGPRTHVGGWQALAAAGGRPIDPARATERIGAGHYDLIVDAVLGIGGRAGLSGPAAGLAATCAAAGAPVVAVDLPSGIDADRPGVPDSAFRAAVTVTFGAPKLCHVCEPARSACGAVRVIDIGLDLPAPTVVAWTTDDVRSHWPVPGPTSDKYARGVVGIDAGSDDYVGAAVLATTGAVLAGAGMVRFLGAPAAAAAITAAHPDVVRAAGRVQAWLLGSGWGEREDGDARVREALDTGLPLVVDADGLRHLPTAPVTGPVLLTPHAGELARLLGVDRRTIETDPLAAVRQAVAQTGATVLLKGATQYVASPDDEPVRLAVPGPAWTARAGSGDTLAGICASLLAAGLAPGEAALAGASIQALTAADHPGPVPPADLARLLPETVRRVLSA